ncbi:MAG: flavodoxin domain-containing protein [Acholeplasmataceae bacterium]|nr:flavodoxin domain-containing protein [Acholeplasmataceae bacterium]
MKDILVVYWTATGNTEEMAKALAEVTDADLYTIDEISPEDTLKYDKIAFGCPAMGDTFEEAEEFFDWYEQLEYQLDGKKVAIFGSFGWGSGEWMEDWAERMSHLDVNFFEEPLMANEAPSSDELENIQAFGARFKSF